MHGLQRSAIASCIVLASLLLTFAAPSAQATAIYTIDTPNSALAPYLGPYAIVAVDLTTPTSATVTFTSQVATSGNTYCTPANPCTYAMGGHSAIALNVAGSFTVGTIQFAPATAGPFTVGAGNVSEFGTFNLTIDNFDGVAHSASLVSFSLTNSNGTWANAESVLVPNDLGNVAGGHYFVLSDICRGACVTGFAGDGSPVPEPGTFAMLGVGLMAAGVVIRRSISRA